MLILEMEPIACYRGVNPDCLALLIDPLEFPFKMCCCSSCTRPVINQNTVLTMGKDSGSFVVLLIVYPFDSTLAMSNITPPTTAFDRVIINPYAIKKVSSQQKQQQKQQQRSFHSSSLQLHQHSTVYSENEFIPLLTKHYLERFFCCMLRTSVEDYLDNTRSAALWTTLCRRVGLVVPTKLEPSVVTRKKENTDPTNINADPTKNNNYFESRAALILEEARAQLSQALLGLTHRTAACISPISCHKVQPTTLSLQLEFVHGRPFTKEQLFHLRPGTVFQLTYKGTHKVLAVLLSQLQPAKHAFTLLVFDMRHLPDVPLEKSVWQIMPVTTMVSAARCFQAMSEPENLGIWKQWMEQPQSATNSTAEVLLSFDPKQTMYRLPTLNASQQKACHAFLNAAEGITVVQGPPGTGKTTLLCSVICQYMLQKPKSQRRLMVCAPTNKAVSVLASRFMAAIADHSQLSVILAGDGEKLLTDETLHPSQFALTSPLRGTFLYQWMTVVQTDYRKLLHYFSPDHEHYHTGWTAQGLEQAAVRLEQRLKYCFAGVLSKQVFDLAARVTQNARDFGRGMPAVEMTDVVMKLLQELKDIPPDLTWRTLLGRADVIFCTLVSAGGVVFQHTSKIHDLIIDEAAAATEPEICIPLHLQPKRIMAVGDPKQLPATVLSRKAMQLGLDKSLHERLMYDCGYEHIMLDVQYRMNPMISSFPSFQFYGSKLTNGANVARNDYAATYSILNRRPYTFLQVVGVEEHGFGGSYRNPIEASVVAELVSDLQAQGRNNVNWHSSDRIRIITFYQAQVSLLKKVLRDRGFGDKIVVATGRSLHLFSFTKLAFATTLTLSNFTFKKLTRAKARRQIS
jgi:hypothetical protein